MFTCGAQRTWDTACGQHVRAYKYHKDYIKNLNNLNLFVKIKFTLAVRNRHGIRHVANMSVRIN